MIIRLFICQHTYIALKIYKSIYKNEAQFLKWEQFPDIVCRRSNSLFSENSWKQNLVNSFPLLKQSYNRKKSVLSKKASLQSVSFKSAKIAGFSISLWFLTNVFWRYFSMSPAEKIYFNWIKRDEEPSYKIYSTFGLFLKNEKEKKC